MSMTPPDVRDEFNRLAPDQRARCLALLCEPCLSQVRRYFAETGNTTYQDSIVGLRHVVDVDLPVRALGAIRSAHGIPSSSVLASLAADYAEPITAHQDDDFRIADRRAEFAYLSIYNLVRSCRDPDDLELAWLVVRQALAAVGPEEPTRGDVDKLLNQWMAGWMTA